LQLEYFDQKYEFHPHWKAGLRYDKLFSDNRGDEEILEESGLASTHDPSRISTMVSWMPREYAAARLQYSRDKSRSETDHQWFLQFVYSFSPHGAHQF